MNWLRRHCTYANLAATLALVIAVAGGTAIARNATAPKNSVTTKSIRPFNVTARDLTRLIEVRGQATFNDPAPPDDTFNGATATAICPAGTLLITGGGVVDNVRASLSGSQPTHEGWIVSAKGDGTNEARITSIAWCLSKRAEKPTP